MTITMDRFNLGHQGLQTDHLVLCENVMLIHDVLDQNRQSHVIKISRFKCSGSLSERKLLLDLFKVESGMGAGFAQRLVAAAAIIDLEFLEYSRRSGNLNCQFSDSGCGIYAHNSHLSNQ